VRVGEAAQGRPLDADQRTALEAALRYFREAAPKHTADEEESLFPRLRTFGGPYLAGVLERVAALEHEHVAVEPLHAEVDRLGRAWLAAGSLPAPEASRFLSLTTQLQQVYRMHIAAEEEIVFPAAAQLLPEGERMAIGAEMAARRGQFLQDAS
jgi:iron-sulfur cluster repair protein YtfE (RIC family)